MSNPQRNDTRSFLPLPSKTFRKYIYFWHFITLGGLAFTIFLVLSSNWGNISWRELTVSGLLVAQILIYIGMTIGFSAWSRPRWLLPGYFILSLGLWLVEVLLIPEVFWVGFAYLGQMFGMLPLLPALIGTVFVFGVIFFGVFGVDLFDLSTGELFGWIAGWGSIVVLLVYLNHLARTSQERARLIDELQRAQEELQRARQKEAELAVLRERERLARDMHDTLGHNLVALSIQLEAVQRLYQIDPQAATERVEALKDLTRSSMEELRRTLAGLRAPGLGERQLDSALRELCVEFSQRTHLEVTCQVDEAVRQLTLPVAETLWRTAQEGLTNVEKHAQASRVSLLLNVNHGQVTMEIHDNGLGFDPDQARSDGHYGLVGMQERLAGIGGQLILESQPGQGTRLEVQVPLLERET